MNNYGSFTFDRLRCDAGVSPREFLELQLDRIVVSHLTRIPNKAGFPPKMVEKAPEGGRGPSKGLLEL